MATTLHYFEEMSYQEIADSLHVSIATIEGRLYRARRQLKEEILKMTSQQPDLDATAVQQMIDTATREMHEQIADLQKQLRVSYQQEQSLRRHQIFAASETITRLPSNAEDPISWGVVGAYRILSQSTVPPNSLPIHGSSQFSPNSRFLPILL